MREAPWPAVQRWILCALGAIVMIAAVVETRAQPAPSGDEALVLTADEALGAAMRAGDKLTARKILSLQFSFVDEDGKVYERKNFLAGLKDIAAAPASDVKVTIYGRIGMVTGHRKSAHDNEVFFLDIWAKQKGTWRALVAQDVELGSSDALPIASAPNPDAVPYDCKNPCQTIPYRVRSPAEQDIVNSFQAIEKAAVGHDAEEWSKHVADEFVLYGSGRSPISKSERIAAIERQKQTNATVQVGEVEAMRLAVYDDSAAMVASHVSPDDSRPPYRATRVWVRRNGQWQMAISAQTDVKSP
jgi:Domain of unknown function (DUF4440)